MNADEEYKYPVHIVIFRSALIFIFFLIVKFASVFACAIANFQSGFELYVQLLPSLIALPLIFNSIIYITTVYNSRERVAFPE